jgi:hypothetical protein
MRNARCSVVLAIIILANLGCSTIQAPHQSRADSPLFRLENYASVQTRLGQNPNVTVVVAISGGGYRAANLGIGALAALEDVEIEYDGQKSNLLNEVDYITTVSGGGFAAGTYMQWLLSMDASDRSSRSFKQHILDNPNKSGVSENVSFLQKTLAWRILGYNFSPRTYGELDRGDLLQERLDSTILRKNCDAEDTSQPCSWVLGDIFKAEGDARPVVPYWIANATNYVSGEIFSFTPDNICAQDVAKYTHRQRWREDKTPLDCSNRLAMNVPLALGMRSSANFPVGLPATTLVTSRNDNIKLSDGGQADNLAFYSALEILFQEAELSSYVDATNEPPVRRRRLLIIVDAFRGALGNAHKKQGAPDMVSAAFRSPSLPLDALRTRIRGTVSTVNGSYRSEIDSVLLDSNLAVAYINIDDEEEARAVGTTFWLSESEQRLLIEAGYRQASAVLSGICSDFGFPANPIEIEVLDQERKCSNSVLRRTIEFNTGLASQRRAELAGALSMRLNLLAGDLANLSSSIDEAVNDINRDRQAELEREHYAVQLGRELQQDDIRAYNRAMTELQNGRSLISALRVFEDYDAKLSQKERTNPHISRYRQELRPVACETYKIILSFGFPYRGSSAFGCSSEKIDVRGSGGNKLVALHVSANVSIRDCRRLSVNNLCEALSVFQGQIVRARARYEASLSPTTELIHDSPTFHAPRISCPANNTLSELSANISVQAAAVSLLHAQRLRIPNAELERINDAALSIQNLIGKVPESPAYLQKSCNVGFDQIASRLEAEFIGIALSLDDVNCLLSRLPTAWPLNSDRSRLSARQLFENESTENVCGVELTVVPNHVSRTSAILQPSD